MSEVEQLARQICKPAEIAVVTKRTGTEQHLRSLLSGYSCNVNCARGVDELGAAGKDLVMVDGALENIADVLTECKQANVPCVVFCNGNAEKLVRLAEISLLQMISEPLTHDRVDTVMHLCRVRCHASTVA